MKVQFGAFLALVVTSVIFAQTGNDIVDNGITAGTELAQAIGDRQFATTMGKLATRVGPYLGMVGPAIGIIAAIAGIQEESAELKFMRDMLSKIENRFDQVDRRLDEIARKMDWNRVRVQFFTFEKKIKAMKMELDKFYNASGSDFTSFRDTFATVYECVYENSAQMLYNHIVSHGSTFSSNVLTEAVQANQNDRRDIQTFMLGLTKLILVGSQVEMAYYKIKHPNSLKGHEQKWTGQINEMRKAMEKVDRDLTNNFRDVATNDAKHILTFNKGSSKSAVANKVYEKLTQKFYWRNWFVAVYNDIAGGNNHWVWLCHGAAVFRHSGFNLLLASNPKGTGTLNASSARSLLRNAKYTSRNFWGTKTLGASDVFKNIKFTRNCGQYSGVGVVRSNANFSPKSESNRYVQERRGPYYLFMFH
ncbi:uncharacterized protein LOC133181327 [Saccostrea echinata]|uniref:uncharacterized protein LOC133181327 n=1 Tax=Saccostrea echinata TaxID=191078 RepID=UPI002A7F5654|nr:uncharacterized protein LOC133181327 [Saccostrea echinata]